jgi:hypothetical protein
LSLKTQESAKITTIIINQNNDDNVGGDTPLSMKGMLSPTTGDGPEDKFKFHKKPETLHVPAFEADNPGPSKFSPKWKNGL